MRIPVRSFCKQIWSKQKFRLCRCKLKLSILLMDIELTVPTETLKTQDNVDCSVKRMRCKWLKLEYCCYNIDRHCVKLWNIQLHDGVPLRIRTRWPSVSQTSHLMAVCTMAASCEMMGDVVKFAGRFECGKCLLHMTSVYPDDYGESICLLTFHL